MTGPHPGDTPAPNGGPRSRRDRLGPWRTIAVTPITGHQIALYLLPDDPEPHPVYLQVPVIAWFVQVRTTERGRGERVVCAVLDLPTGRIVAVDHPTQNHSARRLIAVGDPADVRAVLEAYPKGSS